MYSVVLQYFIYYVIIMITYLLCVLLLYVYIQWLIFVSV
jgi:hypothetical protein